MNMLPQRKIICRFNVREQNGVEYIFVDEIRAKLPKSLLKEWEEWFRGKTEMLVQGQIGVYPWDVQEFLHKFYKEAQMEKKQNVAIDFDNVIHQYSRGWQGGELYGKPIEGAKAAMKGLVDKGYNVVILTARIQPKYPDSHEQKKKMEKWLKENGFLLNQHYHEVTNNKPSALVYIDDAAVRFTSWKETNEVLKCLL